MFLGGVLMADSIREGRRAGFGIAGRGLMMTEQIALDSGRTQFAWLLSAMPDPDLQQISQNRKRVSLKPYSKLAAAPWIAGNIAFLKDLDYLENRLKASGKNPDRADDANPETENKKASGKKKNKGKAEDTKEPAEQATS